MSTRREFITLLGSAAAWPVAARAQQPAMPVIGFLNAASPDGYAERLRGFRQGLKDEGFGEGENVSVEYRWAENQLNRVPAMATELVRRQVSVIVATGGNAATTGAKAATTTIPVLFVTPDDPVALGYVASLARPGGNITGFALYEYSIVAKWLALLKQLAPSIDRVAVLYDPNDPTNRGQLPEIASRVPALAVQSSTFSVRNAAEITDTIDAFANKPNGGLVVLPNPVAAVHRELIAALATKHRLPAVYPYRYHVASGGLASYGVDIAALYRGAASYVDRILKGEKPAELPVQFATKFELVINLKAAAALGLDIPVSLLARTDEVIE
jgi:putative ABC transport system substrate-binding protein